MGGNEFNKRRWAKRTNPYKRENVAAHLRLFIVRGWLLIFLKMNALIKELFELSDEIITESRDMSQSESLKIAAMVQYNRMYRDANVLFPNTPSALESIAMQLGQTPITNG